MSGNWWKSTLVYSAICFTAKWIHVFLSLAWKAMPLIKVFNISARLCTLQAMCIGGLLMSLLISTIYEQKYDWDTFQRGTFGASWWTFYRGGSIGSNNWALNIVHANELEGYFGHKTWPTLPCFDLNTISRVFDDWVPHCVKFEVQARDFSVPGLPMLHR